MEICCYSPHSKTNALIDCIYHSQTPCYALLSPADSRRRASKVAWDLCPDRVQEMAGYPLNGRPSAVTMPCSSVKRRMRSSGYCGNQA